MSKLDTFIPKQQPEFPEKDLTEENAEMLSLILGNRDIVMHAHVAAENVNYTMKVAHPAVVNEASSHTDGARVAAVSYGNNLFEGVASMVTSPKSGDLSPNDIINIHGTVTKLFHNSGNIFVDFSDTVDEFKTTMPNTTELIEETSSRFFHHLTGYALFGAALERKIILDTQTLGNK